MILEAESYENRSYITIITQNFILIGLTSIATPHLVWLSFRALGFLQTTYLVFYHFMQLISYLLCHRIGKVSMYKFKKTFQL